jgi:hypothetical protein
MAWTHGPTRFVAAILLLGGAACSEHSPDAPEEVFVARKALGTYNYTDHVAWSQSPPGGLPAAQVPQFVQIGFDDNPRSSGMSWATTFFRTRRNPAGTGNAATFDNSLVRVSFYNNSTYISNGFVENPTTVKESWRTAVNDGHETGNHTHGHPDGAGFTIGQWDAEMDLNTDWLTRPYVANGVPGPSSGLGASLASIEGFRAPFLSYNPNAFLAMKNNGFTYDISVEEGWQLNDTGTNFNWPYTLDNGSPGGTAVGRPTGNHSGLWELGTAPFVTPPDVRQQTGLVRITGLDFNVFISAGLNKAQALSLLKYNLDQRLGSNRAPFFIGAHTNIYTDAVTAPNTTTQERREVIEEFVIYALSKPQVRIVTAKSVINWMRNPVALGGVCSPETNSAFCARLGKNCGTVSGTDNCGVARTVNSCGTCAAPQTCGGGGTANLCGGGGGSPDRTEGGTVSATGTPCNATNEGPAKAYDNLTSTKWCVSSAPSTTTPISTVYDFSGTTAFAIDRYTITTANDVPGRDPKNWTLQGCQGTCTAGGGTGWVTIDTRTNQLAGAARFQTTTYTFTNTTAYQQYRLRVTANNGDTARFQLAEIQLFDSGTCTPESNSAFCARLGKNCGSVTAADNCGTTRTVTSCGTCTAPQTCGGGGTANVCGTAAGGNCNAPAWSASATYSNGSIATANCTAAFLDCSSAELGHKFAWRCTGADPAWCSQFQPGSTQNYNGIWTQLEQCN